MQKLPLAVYMEVCESNMDKLVTMDKKLWFATVTKGWLFCCHGNQTGDCPLWLL